MNYYPAKALLAMLVTLTAMFVSPVLVTSALVVG